MHCYRVTTYNPAHPVYILRATMQQAFELARANTTKTHSPVVALINLPVERKENMIDALNDPTTFIGDHPSMKAWEFTPSARGPLAHELMPGEGERKADARRKQRALDARKTPAGREVAVVLDAKADAMRAIANRGTKVTGGPLRDGKPAWPFYKGT